MAKQGEYLTTKEYAEKMGMTVSTVTKQLRSGKIKGVKQGGKWMIPAGAPAPKKAAAKKAALKSLPRNKLLPKSRPRKHHPQPSRLRHRQPIPNQPTLWKNSAT